MYETPQELMRLQRILDESAQAAGPHMQEVITRERWLSAEQLVERLHGMVLLVLGTATSDGKPLVGPVDSYFIHGSFFFSSGRRSVRMRHLSVRPAVSACHLPSEGLAVTVHGSADLFEISDPRRPELRQAMLDHYLPLQGEAFQEWLETEDILAARIDARKLITFHLESP